MKKKTITLFFLIILSTIALADDWQQEGKNILNSYASSATISSGTFTHLQNFSTDSTPYEPLYYDYDHDGYNDIITVESDLLTLRRYNGTAYQLASEAEAYGMISNPFMLNDGTNQLIVGYSQTTFLVYKIDSTTGITLFAQKTLNTPTYVKPQITKFVYTIRSTRPSTTCYSQSNSNLCIVVGNTSDYEIFNISAAGTILSNAYNNANLTGYYQSYKPFLYPNPIGLIPIYYVGVYCNTTTRYGFTLINMTDGTTYKSNCSITSDAPFGDAQATNGDGGNYEILFTTNGAAGINKIHLIKSTLYEAPGYPVTTGGGATGSYGSLYLSSKGKIYNAHPSGGGKYQIQEYDYDGTLSTTFADSTSATPASVARNLLSAGSDFLFVGGAIYRLYDNTWIYPSSAVLGEEVDAIIGSDGTSSKIAFTDYTTPKLRIFESQTPPLTYPNVTLAFRSNISNNSLGVVEFIVNNTLGAILEGFTTQSGEIYIGQYLPTGSYNMTFNTTGYLPYNRQFNITNGTKIYYFYAIANGSYPSAINLQLFDETNGLNIQGVTLIASIYNGTSLVNQQNNTLGYFTFNVSAGNYSISVSSPNQLYQTLIIPQFYHSGIDNLEYGMTGVLSVIPTIPMIKTVEEFAYQKTIFSNGSFQINELYNPAYICLNGTTYLNVSLFKKDTKGVSAVVDCGKDNQTSVFSAWFEQQVNYFPASTIYFSRTIGQCTYNQSGDYTIRIIPYSSDFPYSMTNYTSLVEPNGATSVPITVSSACVGTLINDLTKTEIGKTEDTGITAALGGLVTQGLGAQSTKSKLFLWFIITTILAVIVGGAIASMTQEASGFMYGVVTIFSISVMIYVFVYNLIAGFVLFALVMMIGLGLLIASKRKVFKNEG